MGKSFDINPENDVQVNIIANGPTSLTDQEVDDLVNDDPFGSTPQESSRSIIASTRPAIKKENKKIKEITTSSDQNEKVISLKNSKLTPQQFYDVLTIMKGFTADDIKYLLCVF